MISINKFIVYLVPFILIVGKNFNANNFIGLNISIGYTELIILILLFLMLIKKGDILFPKRLLIVYLLSFLGILLSFVFSSSIISVISIVELIRWVEYFLLFICIYNLSDADSIKNTLLFLALASVLFICVSIYQVFTFNFYEKRIYGTFVSAADLSGDSVSNPNVAGAFLVGCFLMFYSFKKINNNIKRLLLLLLQFVTFVLVLFTLSRSAFIGMVIGVILLNKCLNVNMFRYLSTTLILSVILFITVVYFFNDYKDFIIFERAINTFDTSTISGSSVTGRIDNSSIILDIALHNIIFGIGFGDLENKYNLVPDNFYIHLFAETGIIGLLTTIILLIIIFKDIVLMRNLSFNDNNFFFHFTSAFLVVYITFLVENYAANLFRSPRLLGLFWFILALLYKYSFIISLQKKSIENG